jgi:hypothetical protein
MAVVAVIAVGLLVWTGTTLLLDVWWRRPRRPDLAERPRPFQPVNLADQGQTEAAHRRHAEHYIDLARGLFVDANGPGQLEAIRRVDAEHDNLLAAMAYAVDLHDIDLALGLLTCWWHDGEGPGDLEYLPDFALDVLDLEGATEHPLYPAGLATACRSAALRGDRRGVEELARAASDAAERLGVNTPALELTLTGSLVSVATILGAFGESVGYAEHLISVARSAGLRIDVAFALWTMAVGHVLEGDLDKALPLAKEGLALAREIGNPLTIGFNLIALSGALADRDPEQGRALLDESIRMMATFEGVRHTYMRHTALLVAARLGAWDRVPELAAPSIRDYLWNGETVRLGGVLTVLIPAILSHDPECAARLHGAARRLVTAGRQRPTGQHPTPTPPRSAPSDGPPTPNRDLVSQLRRQTTARLHHSLSDARVRELRAEGEALDDDRVSAKPPEPPLPTNAERSTDELA